MAFSRTSLCSALAFTFSTLCLGSFVVSLDVQAAPVAANDQVASTAQGAAESVTAADQVTAQTAKTDTENSSATEIGAGNASGQGQEQGQESERAPLVGAADSAISSCISSFNETRERVLNANTQSVILHSNANGIAPYIALQSIGENGSHYVLWQSLNGDIKGYALREGKGFDYANNANTPLPLAWHPTLIWDHIFGSDKELKNYSCVLTGRTRVMGKRVSLLRLIPQEGLRYSFLIAKEDESDFPVELSVIDPKGGIVSRLTTMDSRIVVGVEFPISDSIFDRIEQSQQEGWLGQEHPVMAAGNTHSWSALSDDVRAAKPAAIEEAARAAEAGAGKDQAALELVLPSPTVSAGATVSASESQAAKKKKGEPLKAWPELNIPSVYTIIASGQFNQGGSQCFYQEFTDGLTSFRVYRNQRSTTFYPVLSNGSISIVRKNTMRHEYAVVGEVPVTLAEFVLTKIAE